jgi:hypothetical protein
LVVVTPKKKTTASIYIYFCGGEMLSCVTAQSIVRSENGQALRWTMWRRCSVGQSGSLCRNGRGGGNPSLSRGRYDEMICMVDLPHLKRVTEHSFLLILIRHISISFQIMQFHSK